MYIWRKGDEKWHFSFHFVLPVDNFRSDVMEFVACGNIALVSLEISFVCKQEI